MGEQHSTVKQGDKVSSKVCWPTSLERQNVNLALLVFNCFTFAALKIQKHLHQYSRNETANFVYTISQILKIININTPPKHLRLNDECSRPLVKEDKRFLFLHLVTNWFKRWRSTIRKDGKLSAQTFISFHYSCNTSKSFHI